MARGGKRQNAGRPSTWASGCTREDTKPVRIPKAIVDQVLDYAHRLDAGENFELTTQSKSLTREYMQDLRARILRAVGTGKQAKPYRGVKKFLDDEINRLFP